ncbi:DUF6221 family protein [Streptomyces phaeochromogenes]|uniref:DUF6221 family protein n=1 Tax=Streptomyces phaeochromogenes TaxID=1923 RepID=UPI0022582D17|nr:DUF6221 family protein [Streptomyces phaeochromogenes]MCX5601590.1 DUF6221 family protein [Streptomyces phaeochromogenes]
MDDLVQWLGQQLDEDERIAEAASPGPWRPNEESDEVLAVDGITVADGFALSGRQLRATTEHIARHDPARVLREVAVTRRAIESFERCSYSVGTAPHEDMRNVALAKVDTWRFVLRLRALSYADWPGYKEAWRP